ncbi:MAG: ABC transporter ATP-binding protein [Alphaproteobacteria bacterium PRO2]|nr:ABC transporter ATP-binding protein [Alphaproteobacteria bacterium PRO2]
MADILLKTENITRTLPGDVPVTLVRGADVEIKAGEFVVVTGPSGSGKSSLLYLLGLLDHPTSGQIKIDGLSTAEMTDDELAAVRLEKIGFVFQFHFLLPEFTALENVMMPMRRLGKMTEQEMKARAAQLLTDLGLKDHMHKIPRKMSGGQCQRVAIARALANDPMLLLADEPTGNLDTAASAAVHDIFRELARTQKRAVVAVTHDMDFAGMADRRIHIVDGKIVKD